MGPLQLPSPQVEEQEEFLARALKYGPRAAVPVPEEERAEKL
jgi:hypothetical protein